MKLLNQAHIKNKKLKQMTKQTINKILSEDNVFIIVLDTTLFSKEQVSFLKQYIQILSPNKNTPTILLFDKHFFDTTEVFEIFNNDRFKSMPSCTDFFIHFYKEIPILVEHITDKTFDINNFDLHFKNATSVDMLSFKQLSYELQYLGILLSFENEEHTLNVADYKKLKEEYIKIEVLINLSKSMLDDKLISFFNS